MPELNFAIESASAVKHAASPLIVFKLRTTNADTQEQIQNVQLQCQLQLQVVRRQYTPEEKQQLKDLFGEPERWGETLRTMFWTQVAVSVPPFVGSTVVDLQIPCTFDFNVAASKYFFGLDDGEVPIEFLFNGSVFYRGQHGQQGDDGLQISQISWSKQTQYRMPVSVWQDMMDHYYPNSSWLRIRRDVFERLYQYKINSGIATWEQTLDRLLAESQEATPI